MATTINAANIAVNFQMLKDGGFIREEINEITRAVNASKDPFEDYRRKVALLEKAYRAGGISADQMARSVEHLNAKLPRTEFQKFFDRFGDMATAGGIAYGARSIAAGFSEIVQQIDEIADEAAKAGTSFNDMVTLQRALSEVGGISVEQVTDGVKKMMLNLGKAKTDGGELADELTRMGMSAESLTKQSAVNAVKEISRQFQSMSNHADKLRLAQLVFGRAGVEMVPALEAGESAIASMAEHLERAGVLIGDEMAGKFGKLADSMERFMDYWNGVTWSAAGAAVTDLQNIENLTGRGSIGNLGSYLYEFAKIGSLGGPLVTLMSAIGGLSGGEDTPAAARERELQEEIAMVGKERMGNSLPNALRVDSVEAYKFLASENERKAEAQSRKSILEDMRRELAELNRKRFAVIEGAR